MADQKVGNLNLWQELGGALLRVQPYMDSIIVDGKGSWLIDANGKKILDLAAGQFCAILGYNHEDFVQRMQQATRHLLHVPNQYITPHVLKNAQKLAAICPGDLNQVLFLSTGSEANECALRMAKTITRKTGTLALNRAYHGISLATRNLSAISDYPWKIDFQPRSAHNYRAISPTCSACPVHQTYPGCNTECLDVSLELIGSNLSEIGAIVVEPVLSAGGMIFPPKEYIWKLYQVSRDIGALFIADEAQTGLGRCGSWFVIEQFGVIPDILVLSKTAGNGFPVSAIVVRSPIATKLEKAGFTHLSSHQNDPVSSEALGAVIDIIQKEKLVEEAKEKGNYFLAGLKQVKEKHSCIKEINGKGLMIGIRIAWEELPQKVGAFHLAMLCEQEGIHLTFSYYEQVLRIIPPLIIQKDEIDFAIQAIDRCLFRLSKSDFDLKSMYPFDKRNAAFVKRLNGKSSITQTLNALWHNPPQKWVEKVTRALKR